MKQVIYKFGFDPTKPEQTIQVDGFVKLLSMKIQHGKPVLWILVYPDQDEEPTMLRLLIRTTGEGEIEDGSDNLRLHEYAFLGTLLFSSGAYVIHVFCSNAISFS